MATLEAGTQEVHTVMRTLDHLDETQERIAAITQKLTAALQPVLVASQIEASPRPTREQQSDAVSRLEALMDFLDSHIADIADLGDRCQV